jgi:Skp family chaperone for outer membrane proteins
LSPATASAPALSATPSAAAPAPTATPLPNPGPSKEEFEGLKASLKDLSQKTADMQKDYDQKISDLGKNGEDSKKTDADMKEQLVLVKNLLDRVQGDLQKTDARLEQVAQKAEEKNITYTELERSCMRICGIMWRM